MDLLQAHGSVSLRALAPPVVGVVVVVGEIVALDHPVRAVPELEGGQEPLDAEVHEADTVVSRGADGDAPVVPFGRTLPDRESGVVPVLPVLPGLAAPDNLVPEEEAEVVVEQGFLG